ncbi:MAG: TM0106 family RecB-like putative nuclease [Gemmatimonadota bacterium]
MHRLPNGTLRFSPRDLTSYLEGDFAAWCDRNRVEQQSGSGRATLAGAELRRNQADEELELAARRGLEHEAAHLAKLQAMEPGLVVIERDAAAHDATLRAMSLGAPIIFQGELQHSHWMGIADFLHRTPGASEFGDFFYEPWDTKLARSAKPYFLLQLCAYAEMLEASQSHRPDRLGFVLGDGTHSSFRTADFWNYYQRLKGSFERFQRDWNRDQIPDPALDRTHGQWAETAAQLLLHVDDLSLVAGISRSQILRLRDAGIDTVTKLARSSGADAPSITAASFATLQAQAEMQVASRTRGEIAWSFRRTDPEQPRRGLALLPPASRHDVFFDIEGFPFASDGLEYLLGVVTVESGAPVFRDWWAHAEAAEQLAFESFMDWVYARWLADPTLHIYHYAGYERTALTRLMGKYATREFEVDELLRHDVLVDLLPVVRQGMVIGTPSYSLKDIEHLYMPARTEEVTSAGGSVVEYQRWIDADESPDPALSPILGAIRDYNRVDCESTVGLRDWLLTRQTEAKLAWLSLDNTAPAPGTLRESTPAELQAARLLQRAEGLPEDSEERRVTTLVAWLCEFHRREEKPYWWRYFERLRATDEDLVDDIECLVGLERTRTPTVQIKRSIAYEYHYDPSQDTKLHEGDACVIIGEEKGRCTVVSVDREAGMATFKIGLGQSLPDRMSVFLDNKVTTKPLREAILRFATAWEVDSRHHPALDDLLHRRPPQLVPSAPPFHFEESGDLTAQTLAAVRALDHSTLCIQGPPGTGKTTTASEVVLALVTAGQRIGIVANSHQVILNLMERIASLGQSRKQQPALVKVGGDGDDPLIVSGRIEHIDSKDAADQIAVGPLVIGGTAWLFAKEELTGTLDYLFVEEAGQFSLANTVAVGASAANLVLLGDQMQLSQPTQGSHPGESGRSALDYLLHGHATVPPDRGIFLGKSHRMHPAICRIVSEAYYDGRLTSAARTVGNRLLGAAEHGIGIEAGVRFVPVVHAGCTQESDDEVRVVKELVTSLLSCQVTVNNGDPRAITLEDILIVAPFNMQVRALKAALGAAARVGSVDKFQGQEAAVVIVSMCASSVDDAPRGPQFLLSPNRLNVAISRAQVLALVVGSPHLGDVRVRSVDEMRLLNGWCRIEECVAP